jgi:hypothetical protein
MSLILSRRTIQPFLVHAFQFSMIRGYASQPQLPSSPCSQCGEIVDVKDIGIALIKSNNPYRAIPFLAKRCAALKDDHFSTAGLCRLADRIDLVARTLLHSRKEEFNVIAYKHSARAYMSAFLKEVKKENTSDLTGDGGELAWKMLNTYYESSLPFSHIIDIGGQDAEFIQHFSNVSQRVIMDRNLLTPFLSKKEGIYYAIGDAVEIWEDKDFLIEGNQEKMLITMNNLLNVLTLEEAWKMLKIVALRMRVGDNLIITNLSDEQFKYRENYYAADEMNGIIQYNKGSSKLPYKLTLKEEFGQVLSTHIPSLKLLKETSTSPLCQLPKNRQTKVHFRTLLFERIEKKESKKRNNRDREALMGFPS